MLKHRIALHAAFAALVLGACAQFGVPEIPPPYRDPARLDEAVLAVYRPDTVLGFGHTGIIVQAEDRTYLRYDQYASAELEYGNRLRDGSAHFWEAVTARLPSIFGLTQEAIVRRQAARPSDLLDTGEWLIPLPDLDPVPIRAAAEARWRTADGLELDSARRYQWMFNNCHHFVRDVLRTGGEVPADYFPKHWVADALARLPPR